MVFLSRRSISFVASSQARVISEKLNRSLENFLFSKAWRGKPAQAGLDGFPDVIGIREAEFDQVVKAAIEGLVQPVSVIGGGDHEAVAAEFFDEDEEAVEQAPHFANIASEVPCVANAVELIEKIDCPVPIHRLENDPEFRKGFPQIAGDQAVQADHEQGEGQLVGQGCGGHGFATARGASEKEALAWPQAVFLEPGQILLFFEDAFDAVA